MPVLTPEQVANPAYVFDQGRSFVEAFGADIGADQIDPMEQPMAFAERVVLLNPRHPDSVFKTPQSLDANTKEYADRYAQADNGLPSWAAEREDAIYVAADPLGIRSRELGTTLQHTFAPGHYDLGLVLEGANNQDVSRGFALAEGIRRGDITVGQVAVAVTSRVVGNNEGQGGIVVGYGVGGKAVAAMADQYPDVFHGRPGGVRLSTLDIRTHKANAAETVTEAALRLNVARIAMAGSNIYGSWMRIDMQRAAHNVGLDAVTFGAGPDDPKAARTPRIWAAEVAQTLVAAAHLHHAQVTKSR